MRRFIIITVFAGMVLTSCSRLLPDAQEQATPTNAQPPSASPTPRRVVPSPTPTEEIVQGTIRVWHSWGEEQRSVLAQIIDDFHTTYPDVYFDVQYVPLEILKSSYEAAALEGGAPDILLGPADWGPALYDGDLVVDLTDQADRGLLNRINPAALDSARYQDALVGLPYSIQGVALFRNKSIIPEAPLTFDDLQNEAAGASDGEQIGAILERSPFFSGAHLEGIGGTLMNPDGMPAFNNEKGIEWLELLRAFEQAGPTEYQGDQDLDLFKESRVGMIIDGTWNMDELAQAIGRENLAIDPWPAYQTGNLSGYIQPDMLYLNTDISAESRPAAWKFIEHFLSQASQTRLTEADLIPAVGGIQVTDPMNDFLITEAMAALAGGTAYPVHPWAEAYRVPLDVALRDYFAGLPAEEVLLRAEEAILATLAAMPTPTATP